MDAWCSSAVNGYARIDHVFSMCVRGNESKSVVWIDNCEHDGLQVYGTHNTVLPVTLQAEDEISDLAPVSSPRTFDSEFRVPGEMVDEGRSVIRLFNVD